MFFAVPGSQPCVLFDVVEQLGTFNGPGSGSEWHAQTTITRYVPSHYRRRGRLRTFRMASSLDVINKWDTLSVVCAGVGGGLLSELLSWMFVYRNPEFRRLHGELGRLHKKMHSANTNAAWPNDKSQASSKKGRSAASAIDRELARKNKGISALRYKANLLTGVIFMVLMPLLYSVFEGVIIARLPFEPYPPFSYMSQSSLGQRHITDCSFTFLYSFTLMLTKQNLQKIMGYAPIGGGLGGPMGNLGSSTDGGGWMGGK